MKVYTIDGEEVKINVFYNALIYTRVKKWERDYPDVNINRISTLSDNFKFSSEETQKTLEELFPTLSAEEQKGAMISELLDLFFWTGGEECNEFFRIVTKQEDFELEEHFPKTAEAIVIDFLLGCAKTSNESQNQKTK